MPGDQPGGGGLVAAGIVNPGILENFYLCPALLLLLFLFFSQKNKNLFSLLSMLPSENNTSVPRRAKEKQAMNAGRPSPCFFLLS